jgi:hypothetical protein
VVEGTYLQVGQLLLERIDGGMDRRAEVDWPALLSRLCKCSICMLCEVVYISWA